MKGVCYQVWLHVSSGHSTQVLMLVWPSLQPSPHLFVQANFIFILSNLTRRTQGCISLYGSLVASRLLKSPPTPPILPHTVHHCHPLPRSSSIYFSPRTLFANTPLKRKLCILCAWMGILPVCAAVAVSAVLDTLGLELQMAVGHRVGVGNQIQS